jgi:uncharacterized membrane protein
VSRGSWFVLAGVVIAVIGFAKTIEPVIEVGAALVIAGWITIPKPKG